MNDYISRLIQKYHRKGILIDTNILLLYIVGSVNKEAIGKFKRTNRFSSEDFDTLVSILGRFQVKITTSNILTETSNLLGHLDKNLRPNYFGSFATGVNTLQEILVKSSNVTNSKVFFDLGLTDAVIAETARDNYVVLTDDFPLYHYLNSSGIDAINYNHIRAY